MELHYVSVATRFGGCMTEGRGAFHFVIERTKLKTRVRGNPEQDMPGERQVYLSVPKEAIKAVQLEKEAFLDIEHPSIKLGIGIYEERALSQVRAYVNFMLSEFQYKLPDADHLTIQTLIPEMRDVPFSHPNYVKASGIREKLAQHLEQTIETILKKHLKICYQTKIMQDNITPYDIVRYYDQNIPVYDSTGNEVGLPNPLEATTAHGTAAQFSA